MVFPERINVMENIILLAIFSYPGAVVDMVYTSLAKDKSFFRPTIDAFRVARDFFFSALVAIMSMPIVIPGGSEAHTLKNWVDIMTKHEVVWTYIVVSLGISVALGGVIYLVRRYPELWIKNKIAVRYKQPQSSQYKKVWRDVANTPEDIDVAKSVFVVYNADRKMVCAGFSYSIPEDIEANPNLALMHCDIVEKELKKNKEESLIGDVIVSYYDMVTSHKIEVREAAQLYANLVEKQKD